MTNNCNNFTNPISVNTGGTGATSFTAYSVLCGGTTSTNPIQSLAGLGNSGDVLTSNGASSLPTFQSPTSGASFALTFQGTTTGNPADNITYFLRPNSAFTSSTTSGGQTQKFVVARNSTIKACSCIFQVGGTLGSAQNCSLNIRINNTTDVLVSSTIQLTSAVVTVTNTSLSQAVNAGDYVEFKFTGAAWSPNPTSVSFSGSIFFN